MTTKWSTSQTSIAHLTLRYRGTAADANTPALRLRVERLLGSIDLQPAGLPPAALLIVRKLQSLQGPPSTSAPPQAQWASHLRTQIATLYRTAARPALNPVSPGTASVLFADPAEMLACLTRDLLNGRVWQQWYWQQMLRHVPPTSASALTAIWSEQAAFVPAILSYLSIEETRTAIALLTSADVSKLISTLNASFDLPSPTHTPAAPTQPPNPPPAALPLAPDLPTTDHEHTPTLPPWQRWLSSSPTPALTPQAQYLLGLIVTLHHAPAFARSASFITQAVSWLSNQLLNPQLNEAALSEASSSNPPLHSTVEASLTSKEASEASAQEIANPTNSIAIVANVTHPSQSTTPNDIIFAAAQPFPTEGLPTALGGILYLINLLTWLDLPDAWAADETLAEHLSSWAIVAALAHGLLGTAHNLYTDDPIWSILATLDNRELGTPIGANLPPQTAFRLPAKWLQRHGPPNPSWIAATDGLRLHLIDKDAAYLIVDVPLFGRSLEEAIATEVNAYQTQGIHADIAYGPHLPSLLAASSEQEGNILIHPNTIWWLERIIGFISHLLIHTLNDPTIDQHTLPETLLRKRGQLIAGRTHIDLYMPMDQINLPIRRAGLDRDPSWVPNLGRIVLFHFGQET